MAKAESVLESECSYGYTEAQVAAIMGPRLPEFQRWMAGQTQAICNGAHCREPHGVVTYVHDVRRFFDPVRMFD